MTKATHITAESVLSVQYATTRIGEVGTGFTMSIVVDSDSKKEDGVIKITDEKGEYIWGTDKGIVVSNGITISRTAEGRTIDVTDRLSDFLSRPVVVTSNTDGTILTNASPTISADRKRLSITTRADVKNAVIALSEGNIPQFMEYMFGSQDLWNIKINFDKIENSPLIKVLKESGTKGGRGKYKNILSLEADFVPQGVYSVGDFFRTIISAMGLELHWVKDDLYSLEPPRMVSDKSVKEIIKEIGREDIISLSILTDQYDIPDVIIPSMYLVDSLGSVGSSVAAGRAVSNGVIKGLKDRPERSFRFTTYPVPNFLQSLVDLTEKVEEENRDAPIGTPKIISQEHTASITEIFSSHARKSKLYTRSKGSCTLKFSPDILTPFSWYKIDGNTVFVTEIRHSLSRTSATTQLTIGGVYDESFNTENILTGYKDDIYKSIEKKGKEIAKESKEKVLTTIKHQKAIQKLRSMLGSHGRGLGSTTSNKENFFVHKVSVVPTINGVPVTKRKRGVPMINGRPITHGGSSASNTINGKPVTHSTSNDREKALEALALSLDPSLTPDAWNGRRINKDVHNKIWVSSKDKNNILEKTIVRSIEHGEE